jgi:hypothetical protein
MNIDNLTLGEIKEISKLVNKGDSEDICLNHIGKYHIFRTYSAGVFFGKLVEKKKDECIIDECRRLYYWKTKSGISLSEVAKAGLGSGSKVCGETDNHWVRAIEIIPCSSDSVDSIKKESDYVV